ncbi:short chain dehydrogenase [Aestuariispira ectoiniformans]|uniref:short chain dehydrogenase n=1 Tax=Aestuariispira ectoiniformans TaxID=2775080 RepID=UPI00223BA9F5|nr:short chain dehydrogenase [Aestuariispira ectoiniformans]
MKVVVIGAGGDVGRTVCAELSKRHDVIKVGRNSGDYHADMTDMASLQRLFQAVGEIDAVVVTAGSVVFSDLQDISQEDFMYALSNKVMGQVNVVLAGMQHVRDGGSFTLTNGLLDQHPVPKGVGAATANAALAGFAAAAAIEMPRNIRLNVVSPGLLDISFERYGPTLKGHDYVPSEVVAAAYAESVEGSASGQRLIGE